MKTAFIHTVYTFIVLWILSLALFNLSVFSFVKDAFKDFNYLDLVQSKNIFKYDKVKTDVILVNIENRDREDLAYLIDHIAAQNPKAIGIDAIFKDLKNNRKDSILKNVIQQNNAVLVGGYISPDIYNHPNFEMSDVGFLNITNKGSVIREFKYTENNENSFAFAIAKKYNPEIDCDDCGTSPIKYYGNYEQFIHLGFDDVMLQETLPVMKDKVILLGYLGIPLGSKNDITDKKFTPINEKFSGKSNPDMFGVTIHANIISSVINKDVIKKISPVFIFIISFLLTLFISYFFLNLSKKEYVWEGFFTKCFQLLYTFLIIWISILFFKKSIKLPVSLLIGAPMFAIELKSFAKSIHNYLHRKWNIKNIYK